MRFIGILQIRTPRLFLLPLPSHHIRPYPSFLFLVLHSGQLFIYFDIINSIRQ
jgi:hypothetical protein